MNFGLPQETLDCLREYFSRKPEIECVKIYGSRAMGSEERSSDIDLAVYTKEGSEDITGRLLRELDELPTPYLFDVTDYRRISHPPLKEHIDQYAKLLYTR